MLTQVLLVAGIVLSSCAGEVTPPTARVRIAGPRPLRVVALPSLCRDDEASGACTGDTVDLVRLMVESELDFAGLAVLDSLDLNLTPLERVDTSTTSATSSGYQSSQQSDVTGSRYSTLSPQQQAVVLDDVGAKYLLQIHIGIGPYLRSNRSRETEITLTVAQRNGVEVASSRCHLDGRNLLSFDRAVEWSTQCAVRGLVEAWATKQ